MKKTVFPLLLSALLLLSACGSPAAPTAAPLKSGNLTVAATTYPVYLFTTAVTDGVEGVDVLSVVNQPMSCLHDYTLTVSDMKALEGADVIALNGAGLEDFMEDAFQTSSAAVIDCSAGVDLLPYEGHEGHDEGGDEGNHYDPHIWMDPDNAAVMVRNIADGLAAADPDHAEAYQNNAETAVQRLRELDGEMTAQLVTGTLGALDAQGGAAAPALPSTRDLITFHDGFEYFAKAYDLTILKSIEEEEGSEASAKDINEILSLIREYRLPAIFTEANGSTATAEAIARESGVKLASLSMIMSGEGTGLEPYCAAMLQNAASIVEALG